MYGDDGCPSHLHSQPSVAVSLELMGRGVVNWTDEVSVTM